MVRQSSRARKQRGSEMNTANIITLARKHVGNGAVMESSARGCLADAIAAQDDRQDDRAARMWAIKSMAYSIGGFHSDYQAASK